MCRMGRGMRETGRGVGTPPPMVLPCSTSLSFACCGEGGGGGERLTSGALGVGGLLGKIPVGCHVGQNHPWYLPMDEICMVLTFGGHVLTVFANVGQKLNECKS